MGSMSRRGVFFKSKLMDFPGALIVRIYLPMLRIWTPSPVQEDSTCGGAAELVCRNY